jgi:hypothetical protein
MEPWSLSLIMGVLPIDHGAHPKIMEAHTGVSQAQSKTKEVDMERWKVIVEF